MSHAVGCAVQFGAAIMRFSLFDSTIVHYLVDREMYSQARVKRHQRLIISFRWTRRAHARSEP
jgi:hypothetical protein